MIIVKENIVIIVRLIVLFKLKNVDDTIAGTINKIVKGLVIPPVKYSKMESCRIS